MTKNDVEFRVATIDDLDSFVSLWIASARYHEEIEDRFQYSPDAAEWTRKYYSNQLSKDNFIFFVACIGDDVVGFIEAMAIEKPPIHVQCKVGFISSLFVKDEHRRKSIGFQLWELSRDWLMEQKVDKFQLAVAALNPVGIEFWRKVGFSELMMQMEMKPS